MLGTSSSNTFIKGQSSKKYQSLLKSILTMIFFVFRVPDGGTLYQTLSEL